MNLLIYAASDSGESKYDNIYAIVRDGKVSITSREVHISLSHMNEMYAESLVNKRMKAIFGDGPEDPAVRDAAKEKILGRQRIVQDNSGSYHIQRIGGVDASMHFMVDLETGLIYNIASSFPVGAASPEENLTYRDAIKAKVIEWASTKHDLAKVNFTDAPIPHLDYQIAQISDFPGVINYIKRNNLPIEVSSDETVLMVDCGDDRMMSLAREQLGYEGEDLHNVDSSFSIVEDGREILRLNPPFYFINSSDKNLISCTRSLAFLMVDSTFVNSMMASVDDSSKMTQLSIGYLYSGIAMDIDVGKSLGESMHGRILGAVNGQSAVSSKIRSPWIDDIIEKFGASEDERMSNFMRSFIAIVTAFKGSEHADKYGQYYYLAKAPESIRYKEFFDNLFVMSSSVNSENGVRYDYLVSKYSIPFAAMELFGYEPVMAATYDKKMKVMLRSLEHASEQGNDRVKYMQIMSEAPDDVTSSMQDTFVNLAKDNNPDADRVEPRIRMPGVAKMLSDYPMVFSHVKDMFDNAGMDFVDIPVTLVFDSENPGTGGRYSLISGGKSYFEEDETIFSPPEITLNIINMNNMDDIAEVLIHEASHYLDDLMTAEGLEPSDFMSAPQPQGYGGDFWRSYLHGDPTEFTAHLMQSFTNLKYLGRDYVAKNRIPLKMKLLNSYIKSTNPVQFISKDVEHGASVVMVNSINNLSSGNEYDLAENGSIESYLNDGVKEHESVMITNINPSTGEVTLSGPLSRGYSTSSGAALRFPSVGQSDVRGVREELYGDIIDRAFDYYLNGGDLPRGV